ncbi:MAG: hypothetical protein QXU18_03515 [Thermoplasmatales archaeon]
MSSKEGLLEILFFSAILITIVVFVLKTLNGGVLYWDDGFFPFNPGLSLVKYISAWNDLYFPGPSINGDILYMPFIVFVWIFRFLGLGYSTIDALYIITLLFTGTIGVYFLSKFITINYVFTKSKSTTNFYFGSAVSAFFFIFNYEQMTYYGGEFYQGFIMVNLTPILLYFVLRYFSSPVRLLLWNKYLGFISLTSLLIAGGINIGGSLGPGLVWFGIIVIVTIFLARYMNNSIIQKKNFDLKLLTLIVLISLSMLWTAPFFFYNLTSVFNYAQTTNLNGNAIIIYGGYSNILPTIQIFFTSFYYQVLLFFPTSGSNSIWYAPVQFISTHGIYANFLYVPVLFSFLYIIFLKDKNVKGRNLLFILVLTVIFISVVSQIVNTKFLSYSPSPIIAGLNFSLDPYYSIYPFITLISVNLAVSLNILQAYLDRRKIKDRQTILKLKEERVNVHLIACTTAFKKLHFNLTRKFARKEIIGHEHAGGLLYIGTVLLIIVLISLYIIPIFNGPLENWEFQSETPVTGSFKVNSAFNDVGLFLSRFSPHSNVLYLPVTVSPSAGEYDNSSFMIVQPPFSSYFDGEMISQDPGFSNNTFAYPILSSFPNTSFPDFSNFLDLLSIKYVVVNTAEYPTWVNTDSSNYAEKGPPWNFSYILTTLNTSNGFKFVTSFGPYYIYLVDNSLPQLYSSYMEPSTKYDPLTPTKIFDIYANGSLQAGVESIINSTTLPNGYIQIQANKAVYAAMQIGDIRQYNVTIMNPPYGKGYYDQIITILNYSKYGINPNGSNFYFLSDDGYPLYSWIQFINSTSLLVWVNTTFNTSSIFLDVLGSNQNVLSSGGYVGEANTNVDNIMQVFPEGRTNFSFISPFSDPKSMQILFPSYYQGFGFVINHTDPMNFSDYPFFQLNAIDKNWNPAWQFYSPTNKSAYVFGINGNTSIPASQLKFGYAYVYNDNTTSQNTVQNSDGLEQVYNGDNGIISNFDVDGSKTVNVTFADAFQFNVPTGGMPNVTINPASEIVYPINVSIDGPSILLTNHTTNFYIRLNQNNTPLSLNNIKTVIQNGKFTLATGSTIYDVSTISVNDNFSIKLSVNITSIGNYTLLFESELNGIKIFAQKNIQALDQAEAPANILMNISGPEKIIPGRSYTYTLALTYPNGTLLSLAKTYAIYKNVTLGGYDSLTANFFINKISFDTGHIYFDLISDSSGILRLYVKSVLVQDRTQPSVSCKEISNTHYTAKISSGNEFYLIFNQGYDVGWTASIDGKIIKNHYVANDFANAWLMPKGNYTVSIYFEPEKIQQITLDVSLSTAAIMTALLVSDALFVRFRHKLRKGE